MRKWMLSLLIILMTGSAAFASYEEALELFMGMKYQESLKIIAGELLIDKDMEPNSPNYKLRFLAAHIHWKLGNTASAILHLKRCAEIRKDSPDPLIDLAQIFLDERKPGDARFYALKAVEIKEDALPYYILGNISLEQKNYWKAKEYFEKTLSINPELGVAYNGLGIALMNLNKFSEANTAFSAALALLPDSPEVLNNLALSLKKLGKINEAHGYYSTAIAKMPDNPVINKNMADLKIIIEQNKK